jgi:suppressor of ftsI
MSLNRRQFLKASGVALCAGALPRRSLAHSPQPLPIPPLIESKGGRPIFLSMQAVNWSFNAEKNAAVWGFNGQYLGPTVRVNSGENIKLTCSNRLYEPIGLTVSGIMMPGAIINNKANIIRSESSWSPVLPIRQSACTCWYHANTPSSTARHIYNGLAGMWIIEDINSRSLGLPNQYGVNDFPIILQDKHFNFSGVPEYKPPYSEGFLGDTLLTNGVSEPFVEVGKSWIRLRLLNASNARRYSLSLSNEQPMYLIASDQGTLDSPIGLMSLYLAPGERKEILIDMSQTNEVSLMTGVKRGFSERLRGIFELSNILPTTKALTLRSTGLSAAIKDTLPERLSVSQTVSYSAQQSRQLVLGRNGTINGNRWQSGRIDARMAINSQERWLVSADLPQSFYVQGAQFRVVSVGNKVPPAEDSGWKDTIWIDEPVELLVRFNQTSSDSYPFIYGSQNLELADAGAVGQFVVS